MSPGMRLTSTRADSPWLPVSHRGLPCRDLALIHIGRTVLPHTVMSCTPSLSESSEFPTRRPFPAKASEINGQIGRWTRLMSEGAVWGVGDGEGTVCWLRFFTTALGREGPLNFTLPFRWPVRKKNIGRERGWERGLRSLLCKSRGSVGSERARLSVSAEAGRGGYGDRRRSSFPRQVGRKQRCVSTFFSALPTCEGLPRCLPIQRSGLCQSRRGSRDSRPGGRRRQRQLWLTSCC